MAEFGAGSWPVNDRRNICGDCGIVHAPGRDHYQAAVDHTLSEDPLRCPHCGLRRGTPGQMRRHMGRAHQAEVA